MDKAIDPSQMCVVLRPTFVVGTVLAHSHIVISQAQP